VVLGLAHRCARATWPLPQRIRYASCVGRGRRPATGRDLWLVCGAPGSAGCEDPVVVLCERHRLPGLSPRGGVPAECDETGFSFQCPFSRDDGILGLSPGTRRSISIRGYQQERSAWQGRASSERRPGRILRVADDPLEANR